MTQAVPRTTMIPSEGVVCQLRPLLEFPTGSLAATGRSVTVLHPDDLARSSAAALSRAVTMWRRADALYLRPAPPLPQRREYCYGGGEVLLEDWRLLAEARRLGASPRQRTFLLLDCVVPLW